MPDPSLNMVLRNAGSLNAGLRSIMTLGLSLQHIAYSETDTTVALGFDDVAVTGFTLSVVPNASILALGFASVDATGFDLSIDAGSDAIAFGFESVDATGFALSINEGEQIALGFEDVAVTGFTLSVAPVGNEVSFGFEDVSVTGFAIGIEEGSAIPTTLKDDLVGAFEWEDNYTELHAAYPVTVINSPAFQDSVNGRGILFRMAGGSREVRIASPGLNDWRPLLSDVTISAFIRWQKVDDANNTHFIYAQKGSGGTNPGIRFAYRRDLERFQLEFANGTTRITLVTDVFAQTLLDDGFKHILAEIDRDGHMKIEFDGADAGDRDNTSLVSSMVADSIEPTQVAVWGGGEFGQDNCYYWKRLLTTDEKTALRTLNLGYSDLP